MYCCAQVYGEGVEALTVTSVVECIGILSKHPYLTHFEGSGGAEGAEEILSESEAERSAHCPPPSLVPRLHCILVKTLTHCNPLLPRHLPRPLPGEGIYLVCGCGWVCGCGCGCAYDRDLYLTGFLGIGVGF